MNISTAHKLRLIKRAVLFGTLIKALFGANAIAEDWGSWDEGPVFDLSGYLEATGVTVLPRWQQDQSSNVGLLSKLRLRGVFEPATNLSVVAEVEYQDMRGAVNPLTRMTIAGFPALDESSQAQLAGTDFNQRIDFDYAYGSASFGPVDLRIGRQPLAWGTAYAFNPTDLANPVMLAELTGEEPPGITAIAPSLTIGTNMGIDGYIGFEDRSRETVALSEMSHSGKLPLGIRARAFLGAWDVGIGFVRAVEQNGFTQQLYVDDYIVAEFAGSLGPFMLYGETAVETWGDGWEFSRSVDAAVGTQYDIGDNFSLLLEYHRRGRGESDPDDYDLFKRLAGGLVAQDYLVGVGNSFFLDDNVQFTLVSIVNLNDFSAAIIPEITYTAVQDFEFGLGISMFPGSRGTEFYGDFRLETPGTGDDPEFSDVDLGRYMAFFKTTWYF